MGSVGNGGLRCGVPSIMGLMKRRLGSILLMLVVVGGAATGNLIWHARSAASQARVVEDASTASGWQTIEYDGVRVDVPSDWRQVDRTGCEFSFERWASSDEEDCVADSDGVSFYASATFDPKYGPGLRRGDPQVDDAPWAGYVYAADYAIYAAGADREVVAGVLASAHRS